MKFLVLFFTLILPSLVYSLEPGESLESNESEKSQEVVDPHIVQIQNQLRNHFATHVQVTHREKKGKIELEYYGNDDLGRILNLLGIEVD